MFEVELVFFDNQVIVTKVRTKTCPESIDLFAIELMPEVRIEFLSSVEKIEYIQKPIFFVYLHTWHIWN